MSDGVLAGDAGWQDAEIACASLPDQRLARRLRRDCQEFRVGAAIVDPKEVLDGTTQSTPHP